MPIGIAIIRLLVLVSHLPFNISYRIIDLDVILLLSREHERDERRNKLRFQNDLNWNLKICVALFNKIL